MGVAAAEQSKVRSTLGLSDGEDDPTPRKKRLREHHKETVEVRECHAQWGAGAARSVPSLGGGASRQEVDSRA
jgi:hypothetical protein